VEPQVLHALDLRAPTAPIVRFLAEISRASSAAVTGFSWGSAATLPYLPRVRYGRSVLAEARWMLPARDLPGRNAPWSRWHAAVEAWRSRHRMPQHVALTEGDQLLPLDLDESAHRAVLRAHLAGAKHAVLTEVPTDFGWFGGRAHEVTVSLAARTAPRWPAVPPVTHERLLDRGHGHLPAGGGPWLLAKIYSSSDRHPEILAHHLPGLWARWEKPPVWWFLRYHDPRPHLRLRIAVPDVGGQGAAMARISDWVDGLRRQGLAGDMQFATNYSEVGRWGGGPLMRLAEEVFAADSRAVVTQLRQGALPDARVLAAANFYSLAIAFTGHEQAGMRWLATHAPATGPKPLDRKVLADAVRIANPDGGWAALRAEPGGDEVAAAWQERDEALHRYRRAVQDSDLDADGVIDSLLHCHHIRAVGIDKDHELTSTRLARAAAKAWLARRENTR
jgi:thiopeptide-type bacteriocin biosynthesis protein